VDVIALRVLDQISETVIISGTVSRLAAAARDENLSIATHRRRMTTEFPHFDLKNPWSTPCIAATWICHELAVGFRLNA
jgi:hypothetical protein